MGSAILKGVQQATGDTIVVMDSDFSHPPQIIPKLVESIKKYQYDIAVASRYIKGGKIENWSAKRKLISKFATLVAKKGLGLIQRIQCQGFLHSKNILNGLNIDAIGYKILLEILVKTKNVTITEIPYTFQDRELGSSKLSMKTIFDYYKSVWKLTIWKARRGEREEKICKIPLQGSKILHSWFLWICSKLFDFIIICRRNFRYVVFTCKCNWNYCINFN